MKRIFCSLFAFLLLTAASANAAPQLRARAELQSPAIRLSDVFEGLPDGKDCEIALSPAPGRSVTYEAHVLTRLAEQYGLEWSAQGTQSRILLTRAATPVTAEMIATALLEKLPAPEEAHLAREVQFDSRMTGFNLPAGGKPVVEVASLSYDADRRRFRAEIVAHNGPENYTQTVAGHVSYSREVPVLTRSLPVGTVIGEADLKWISLNEEKRNEDMIARADQLIGFETRRALGEDEPLRLRDVMPARLVLRGSIVTIKVETPLMLITTQGRALQDGAQGETVRVVNTQSNRTLEATVEATGLVRVGNLVKIAQARREGAVR